MKCQRAKCGGHTIVVDSRHERVSNTIYRRRHCTKCHHRHTSVEIGTTKAWLFPVTCYLHKNAPAHSMGIVPLCLACHKEKYAKSAVGNRARKNETVQ